MAEGLTYEHRMSGSDALMWSIEKDPLLRSTITVVAVLDRAPDRQQLLERIERGSRLVPRMRQRVVSSPLSVAPPRWATDRNFDLHYHVRWVAAAGEGSMRDLLDLAEPLAMQGFDRARPLWELVVVEGLADGRAGVVMKLHHAITDGVGGMKIAMHLVDLERDAEPPLDLPPAPAPDDWSFARRMVDAAAYESRRQLKRARSTVAAAPRLARTPRATTRESRETLASLGRLLRPVTAPLSPAMTGRSLSVCFDSLRVPLADLKAAAKVAGGKLNDAFVAAVAGGFRRYHEELGQPVAALRMNMPINVRGAETAQLAGNQFVPARFELPLGSGDPVADMQLVRRLVEQQRAEPALRFTDAIADLLSRLPTSVVTEVFGSMLKGVDLTTSNVPGVPVPLYLAGAAIEALVPFGPLAGTASNITLLSYVDQLDIGVNMDPAAVTDPELLVECLRDAFEGIVKVA